MKGINIIFPHQLFEASELIKNGQESYLIEEFLFFRQYKFHKQKITFHRASMKSYEENLQGLGLEVHYIDSDNDLSDIRNFRREIKAKGIESISLIDPVDDWLMQRIQSLSKYCEVKVFPSPQFLNHEEELEDFFRKDKKSFLQATFYKQQRKKHDILLDDEQNPEGGKWSFDAENRKKFPRGKTPPSITFPPKSKAWEEACKYTRKHFNKNPGDVSKDRIYPVNHKEAKDWLEQFLTYRFHNFGKYEDALLKESSFINHSLLSPLMNSGLILPSEVVKRALSFAEEEGIPINSTEGFIRQIIGWREFIRGMYVCKGRYSRTRNFWDFKRKIPQSFYEGTTGILPVDQTIKKVLQTGYCHHIERLMVLGNFMLLCEFDPNEVYRWFMELFIDAYDWVMVPNVYGMCLFADGGTFATKPYIGGSNYIKKMSNYPGGDWEEIWDGMFWRFVMKQEDFFRKNHRTNMLVYSLDKMDKDKQQTHLDNAESFIKNKLGGDAE
ncbi:cryptochrome/photolyase family protein [Cyclobacterium amurskyense]|uniref:Deoxyribodipyrimidine photolyase-related protein n=1 Tax=Cyclobacterium amurskyense TaxID=320787 RepID=A0A0H4PCQ0_9BACT|nr:cryptochrome/photolyase family protein [Cyclobacterium amurskyense]AKP52236.1 Deoxyribodipyrimidine photolyase-related protein [Cyclobacterium amurskyense]